jgi:hypothetical protein
MFIIFVRNSLPSVWLEAQNMRSLIVANFKFLELFLHVDLNFLWRSAKLFSWFYQDTGLFGLQKHCDLKLILFYNC